MKQKFSGCMAKAYEAGEKAAMRQFAKFGAVWLILALRHEGFGQRRLERVLGKWFHYIDKYIEGTLDMNQLRNHIRRTVGIEFNFEETGVGYITIRKEKTDE